MLKVADEEEGVAVGGDADRTVTEKERAAYLAFEPVVLSLLSLFFGTDLSFHTVT